MDLFDILSIGVIYDGESNGAIVAVVRRVLRVALRTHMQKSIVVFQRRFFKLLYLVFFVDDFLYSGVFGHDKSIGAIAEVVRIVVTIALKTNICEKNYFSNFYIHV